MTDDTNEWVDAASNPGLSNQILAQALADDPEPRPVIDRPRSSFTRLPNGVLVDDKLVRDFEVQELTGVHEERLAKVDSIQEPGRWIQVLLECGVVKIGDQEATPDLLKSLVIGDRDYLALAIREATYGPDIEFGPAVCPDCGEEYELSVPLTNIPISEGDGVRDFEVPLLNGGRAKVTVPNGSDQLALFESPDITEAERKSILLSRCVKVLIDSNGGQHVTAGFPSLVRNLGIRNRDKITKAISEKQFGPRYDDITFEHDCGFKSSVMIGLMHLFPGL